MCARRMELCFLVVMALATSMTVPVVGALLMFSLMIGPAAAARASPPGRASRSPCRSRSPWPPSGLSIALSYRTNWPIGFFVGIGGAIFYLVGLAARTLSTPAPPPHGIIPSGPPARPPAPRPRPAARPPAPRSPAPRLPAPAPASRAAAHPRHPLGDWLGTVCPRRHRHDVLPAAADRHLPVRHAHRRAVRHDITHRFRAQRPPTSGAIPGPTKCPAGYYSFDKGTTCTEDGNVVHSSPGSFTITGPHGGRPLGTFVFLDQPIVAVPTGTILAYRAFLNVGWTNDTPSAAGSAQTIPAQ